MLNDVLDFSKIEAGKLIIESIAFDLHRTFAETLKALSVKAHEKGLELICDIASDVPLRVNGDPGRIRQILVNLVGNAIKFTERGEIVVGVQTERMSATHCCVHVAVRDTGIGIATEIQDLIFEAFSQGDGSTSRKYGGTGLGLSICHRLVGLMQGRMWVDSVLGEGSTFHFTLCLELDHSAAEPVPYPNLEALEGKQVLIVDDNATNRRVLGGMLEKLSIGFEEATNGAQAIQKICCDSAPFDCILLDMQMPEMDGFDVCQHLHALLPKVRIPPIVLLTSSGNRGDSERCKDLGVVGYFTKPIVDDDLHGALRRILGHTSHPDFPAGHLITRHSLQEDRISLTVLLVEDNLINQRVAVRILERAGHHVSLAINGQEAVERLVADQRFDAILMDMQMPVMDGIDATQAIRQLERDRGLAPTPIIAMTANAMQGDREICLEAGMDDYLAKPIKATELRAILAPVADRKRVLLIEQQSARFADAIVGEAEEGH